MIVKAQEDKDLSDIIRDFKKFTSKKVIQTIQQINESRDWMLDKFQFAAKINAKSDKYKFWQDGFHPILLESDYFINQKLDYIHQNPVKSGLVFQEEHYVYSSAINYLGDKGLLDVVDIYSL